MLDTKNIFLVGGAVRDQLLGRKAFDKDYVVVGSSVSEMKKAGFQQVGKDFPVFLHPLTKDEYALARTEKKVSKGYTGFKVDSSKKVSLEDDLARRDLTINAMAKDLDGNIIDPFNGQQDLRSKVLKHTTSAFSEDPVRVLRTARFLARYGKNWTIDKSTKALFLEIRNKGELQHLVPERVWKETEKALAEDTPSLYFATLIGLDIFPELDVLERCKPLALDTEHQNRYEEVMAILDASVNNLSTIDERFTLLCLCLSDPQVSSQNKGMDPTQKHLCERLKVPNRISELVHCCQTLYRVYPHTSELKPDAFYELIVQQTQALSKPERFNKVLNVCKHLLLSISNKNKEKNYKATKSYNLLYNNMITRLRSLDTKTPVKQAMDKGVSGTELGRIVKATQTQEIAYLLREYK